MNLHQKPFNLMDCCLFIYIHCWGRLIFFHEVQKCAIPSRKPQPSSPMVHFGPAQQLKCYTFPPVLVFLKTSWYLFFHDLKQAYYTILTVYLSNFVFSYSEYWWKLILPWGPEAFFLVLQPKSCIYLLLCQYFPLP